jgi:pyridoxal phosphate enzyme (YggS family)
MLPDYEGFKHRADAVRLRIAQACARAGRSEAEVELLAVTKGQPAEAVDYAVRYGIRAVGENRVQEGIDKMGLKSAAVAWELIGHLQSNKARLAAEHFSRIQSVDSEKLLDVLDRAAGEFGKTLPILLQVNAGRDPAKSGAEPDAAPRLLEASLLRKNLRVEGLMTVAPLSADAAVARRAFENLRSIRDRLAAGAGPRLAELSMGMSGDLEDAIAEGSTIVRVGSALFGSRA